MTLNVGPTRGAEARTATPPGLSAEVAAARLKAEGPNELPHADHRSGFGILREVLKEPMLVLLLGSGAIYAVLGDTKDAFVLLAFACLSILITLVQEVRSERVLEALRDLSSPRALIIRDGKQLRIPGREVVRGDVILLAEGDRVPADARLLRVQDLQADESLLTGESVPVRKSLLGTGGGDTALPGGDDLPYVFSGSLVARGTGMAEVTAIGAATEIGKIGQTLASLSVEPPRLQVQTRRIVVVLAIAGGLVSLVVAALYATLRGDLLEALLAGLAIGMSMLPEELPVVLAIFMAMGAWRMSMARVLTRRAAAIEALGSATVLCTDKTGTLTQNRMTLREVRLLNGRSFVSDGTAPPDPHFVEVLRYGRLACDPEPFDPMERAFHDHPLPPEAGPEPRLVMSYGLRPDLLAMSQIWQMADQMGQCLVATKGAPETIAALCQLSESDRADLAGVVDQMAARGLRVLGIAKGAAMARALPQSQQDLRLEFLGLVGLADPLRASVPAAIAECRRAGIRVKMITGDYPVTAAAIAKEAGLDGQPPVTGADLARLDAAELGQRLMKADIFARIMPDQKLRLVEALKSAGEVVAMTGDGVNDAPSLKSAHIGIAMGGRGTDVAREASAIVLLDDDFGSIVKAIRLGRRIYDNLRKAVSFVFAVHLPIAGLAILPLLFGLPIILSPIHIAFLEMVIDPVCTLVFEAEDEEADIMNRPPRHPDERLFSLRLITWSVTQGLLAFAAVAGILVGGVQMGLPEDELRALAFVALVVVIIALIFVNRSFSPSLVRAVGNPKPALLVVLCVVSAILSLAVQWPVAQDIFRFGPLHLPDLALTGAAGLAVLILLELIKPIWRAPRRIR